MTYFTSIANFLGIWVTAKASHPQRNEQVKRYKTTPFLNTA